MWQNYRNKRGRRSSFIWIVPNCVNWARLMKCALFNLRLGWFCEIATVLSSLFFKQSDGSMEEDDTESLEKKLREKALQSMQRHNKSPEAQPDEDWLVCVRDPLATNKEKHFYLAPKTTHYLEMLWGVGFQMESTQHFFGLILAVTTGWRRSHGAKWRTISALYYLTNLNLSCLEQSATRPCKYYMISQFMCSLPKTNVTWSAFI